jgi:L-rhamnose mutarotase
VKAECERCHDEIWLELVPATKAAGFSNFSLFRRGTQIIAYAEIEPDLPRPWRRSANPSTSLAGRSGSRI